MSTPAQALATPPEGEQGSTAETPIRFGLKLMYCSGEISNSVKVVCFALYSLFFATAVKGLPGTWIGVVALASMAWDAIVDPYIGHVTDGPNAISKRYRSMFIGACITGLGLYAFFSPPSDLTGVPLLIWLLAASFVLRTGASLFNIPYYAAGANLSQDYRERTSITGLRNVASAMGTLLAASLSAVIFFRDRGSGTDPKLDAAAYSHMGLAFGAVMTVIALISFTGTLLLRSRLEANTKHTATLRVPFLQTVRDALRSPSFRVVLASLALVMIGMAMNASLLIHYLNYYVEVRGSAALGSTQGAFYIAALLGTLFWMRAASRVDKHRLYLLSAAATALLMLGSFALFGHRHPLGTGDAKFLLVGYALSGFFGCMMWFLPPSMLADIADEDDLITGSRHEGALFGILSFAKQVATGFAALFAGALLDHFVHLQSGLSKQTDLATARVGIVYSVIPAILFVGAAITMLRYRLTRAQMRAIQMKLQLRQSARQKQFVAEVHLPEEKAIAEGFTNA